jgi:hypothetical protein
MLERADQVFGLGDVLVEQLPPVLIKDGAVGRLKQDVVFRIAEFELGARFFFEIVFFVFGLPIAALQPESVNERAVYAQGFQLETLDCSFQHQRPIVLLPAAFQQILKRYLDGALVEDMQLAELAERFIISRDRLVRRFEIQQWHRSNDELRLRAMTDQ